MAKSYYAFEKKDCFGDISGLAGSVFSNDDKFLISAGSSSLTHWNIRKQEIVYKNSYNTPITSLALKNFLALGFRDGKIIVYTLEYTINNSFEGHDASVSSLCFSQDSLTLYSGSFDTTIIIWDIVGDCAIRRLQGHRDAVTSLFIGESLFSCSRDKMIKEWDSDMCISTLISPGEVWGVCKAHKKVYGACEKFVRVWEDGQELGILERGDGKRPKSLQVFGDLIAVCSAEKLEIWRLRGQKEVEKKLKRRRKRNRNQDLVLQLQDQYEKILSYKSSEKINTFAFSHKKVKSKSHEHGLFLTLSLASNSLELYFFQYNLEKMLKTPADFAIKTQISHEGHRSAARTLSLSANNDFLLSGSAESVKIWDVASEKCTVHIESGYCLCSAWFPGDKYIVVGCKSGEIQVFDILSCEKVVEKKGHAGSVWSCDVRGETLLTGGSDYMLKFWFLDLGALKLKCKEKIRLKDEILAVKFSPNRKYVCAALLDSTIQVLYADSKKLLFSLYSHKLPVTAFDISYDSMLLVSGSSDKNIKIWGMDFGDLHKSIFAHEQPITDVVCVPETHFCLTAGRDFVIKYWDLDTREIIQVLKGHTSEIWNLALSTYGDFIISTSNDLTFFIWTQTDTQLFLSEQKELQIEETAKLEDFGIQKSTKESTLLTHASAETLKSGEALIDSLEICVQYREHMENGGSALPPPHFGGKDEYAFILKQLQSIPSQYLDSVMFLLPYNYALELFRFLENYLDQGIETELVAKTVLLLVKVHENALVTSIWANEKWFLALDRVKEKIRMRTQEYRDLIGRNVAAARFIIKEIS